MAKIDFTVESNRKIYEEEFERVVEKILTELGMQAESAAKKLCPVDTGLLRNSITFALAGESANIDSYESNKTHATTETTQKYKTAGKTVKQKTGKYTGKSPADKGSGVHSVHIGSNVEYAMAQEVGTTKSKPHSFLRPAINNNLDYFKNIVETELKNAMIE